MFNLVLGIFLFLSPIFILLGNNARLNGIFTALQFYQFHFLGTINATTQLQFFEYGAILLFITALFTKSVRILKDKYAGLLLLAFFVNVFFHPSGLTNFGYILLGFLIYYVVITRATHIKRFFWVIFAVASLNTLFAVLQFFGINLIYLSSGRIDGLMRISSHLGLYQALALPLSYSLNPYLAIIPLVGLLLSKSITAIIASIVGMAYLLWHKRQKLGSIELMTMLSILAFFFIRTYKFIFYKLNIRLWVWKETLFEMLKKPLIGHGIGGFKMIHPLGQVDNPYNLYLEVGWSLGIIGLGILLLFITDKFVFPKTYQMRALTSSCLILLISGLGLSFMDFPRIAGTVIVLFGFLTIGGNDGDNAT